jgi:hypothetical protein
VVTDVDRWRRLIAEYGQLWRREGHTPQTRGQRFNSMIAELLQCWGIKAVPNVRSAGEIDVAFTIDGIRYVLEAKWETAKADTGRIAKLQKRVRQRLSGTYGVFLSMSGYTRDALDDLTDGDRLEVLLLDRDHWEAMLSGLMPPDELLGLVRDRASFHGEPYTPGVGLFQTAEIPHVSFARPRSMVDGPLRSAVDGVTAEVVLSEIDSGQLGIACRTSGLLVTTEAGILDVNLNTRSVAMAVPVPDCCRSPLALDDGSIVFARRHGVGRFHQGRITALGGGFVGNYCLCRHPDGSVWVFDNAGNSRTSTASITKLSDQLGDQKRCALDYPPAAAFGATWLSDRVLATIGNNGFLLSSPTTGENSRVTAGPPANAIVALDDRTILTAAGSMAVFQADTTTWSNHEIAQVSLRGSVADLATGPSGEVYLAAYHEADGPNMSFAVVRLQLPAGLKPPITRSAPVTTVPPTVEPQCPANAPTGATSGSPRNEGASARAGREFRRHRGR